MDAEWPFKVRTLLIRGLASLSPGDAVMRRRFYERARQALDDHLNDPENGYSPAHVELETRLFQHVLRTLDRDIRAGVDVFANDYGLSDLKEMRGRMSLKLIGPPTKSDTGSPEEDVTGTVDRLARLLAEQDHRSRYAQGGRVGIVTGVISALIVISKVLASESKLTLIWIGLKPVIFFAAMHVFLSANGEKVVFNMSAAAFAATGICCFIVYLETAKRVSTAIVGYKFLASVPQISWFVVGVAEGLLFFIIDTLMMIGTMALLIRLDLASLPKEPLLFVALWVVLWWVGILNGLILAYFVVKVRFSGRVLMAILRVVALFSGIPFVTEQLPEDYARILLYNPLLHLVQSIRVAYFDGYDSQQVSLPYFFGFLLFLMPLTFLLVCSGRSRVPA